MRVRLASTASAVVFVSIITTSTVPGPITGTSKSKCLRRDDALTSVALPFHLLKAARRSIASVPSIASERYAGAVGDGDTLPQVEAGQRARDLPAVFDIALLVRIRFALCNRSRRREQRLQQERWNRLIESLRPPALWQQRRLSESVFLCNKLPSNLTNRQSGRIEEKIFRACFTCPAIMICVIFSLLQVSINFHQLAESDTQ